MPQRVSVVDLSTTSWRKRRGGTHQVTNFVRKRARAYNKSLREQRTQLFTHQLSNAARPERKELPPHKNAIQYPVPGKKRKDGHLFEVNLSNPSNISTSESHVAGSIDSKDCTIGTVTNQLEEEEEVRGFDETDDNSLDVVKKRKRSDEQLSIPRETIFGRFIT